jgi:hypothetical protein
LEVVVGIFHLGIGVASVNAFKMYKLMYKEEKKEQHKHQRNQLRGGMPKKWSHLEFMVKLVYDLIFSWSDSHPPADYE